MGSGSIRLVSGKDYGFLEDLGMYCLLMHPQSLCASMLPAYATVPCPVKIVVLPYKYVCFVRPETHQGLSYLVQVRCRERCSKQCGFCVKELLFIG